MDDHFSRENSQCRRIAAFVTGTVYLAQNGAIIACAQKGDKAWHIEHLSKDRRLFVKYGFTMTTGEAKTQHYLYEKIHSHPGSTAKTTEIYHAFETRGRTCVVMEDIDIFGHASDDEGLILSLSS
jgi:hypothetical protein